MPTAEMFWDKIAQNYAKRPVTDMKSYDLTMERTRAHLKPDQQALELGCGTGTTALRLADAVDHFTATDFSAQMIAIAQDKAAKQGAGNVTFRQSDIVGAAAGDSDAPFDVVMAFNLLHLIEDLPEALSAVRDMVKPGGLFISKSGCLGEKGVHLRLLIWVMRMFGKAPYVASLTIPEMDDRIAGAGFRIIETRTFPGMAPSRFVVAQKL